MTSSLGANVTDFLGFRLGSSTGLRTAWIISYTPVFKEPRVLRQAEALESAGWRVFVFGLAGQAECPVGWHFLPLNPPRAVTRSRWILVRGAQHCAGRARQCIQKIALAAAGTWLPSWVRDIGARLHQSLEVEFDWKRKIIWRFFLANPHAQPDLVLSHDFFTADIGLRLARSARVPFSVDCHEYSPGQYVDNASWARWERPRVLALQAYFLSRADAVTTVCDGIAELLNQEQPLRRPVRVIRSVPFFVPQPFRPAGEIITVLYHGEIYPSRGLHFAVQSLHMWRPEFQLLLRGYSDPRYVEELWRIARATGVADRLRIEPPVSFTEIVPAANLADIGYFIHQDISPQRRFTLPNKFFEYVMAGLALCVSDLPEMAKLIRRHDLGKLVADCSAETIAAAINSLDRESIDTFKRHSITAAQQLNWEHEQRLMLSLYDELCP
jgi:glycosyltransferase involved in cell wall biosynthesis